MTEVAQIANSRPLLQPAERFPRLRKLGDAIAEVSNRLGAVALFIIIAICGVNVFARYFFHSAISWAEEAMVYLMVFVVFSASATVTWKGAHMHLDMLITRLPVLLHKIAVTLMTLFSAGLLLVLAYSSYEVVSKLFRFGQLSDGLEVPMWIPQGFVFVGLFLISFMLLLRLIVVGAEVETSRIEAEGGVGW